MGMRDLGAAVKEEIEKLGARRKNIVKYDPNMHEFHVSLASAEDESNWVHIEIDPVVVTKNDQSAKFIDQLTGKPIDPDFNPDIFPLEVSALGNYAVQISWSDGFNQIATYEQLEAMERIL